MRKIPKVRNKMIRDLTLFGTERIEGSIFMHINWIECDFGTSSKHCYTISHEALPLKDKHFKFFLGMVLDDINILPHLEDFRNWYMFARIEAMAAGKKTDKYDKHLAVLEKRIVDMKEVI